MDEKNFEKDGLEALGLTDGPERDITAESLGKLSKRGVNRLVPFVGAGLSAVYDLPLWKPLLCRTAERMRSAGDTLPKRIKKLLDKNGYEGAAEVLQDSGREAFEACLREQLGRSFALIRGAIGRLPDLAPNLVLTTNLDRVLEFVFDITPGLPRDRVVYGTDIEKFKGGLSGFRETINRLCQEGAAEAEPPVIIKLHGDVFTRPGRVLTTGEYRKAYLVEGKDREKIDPEKPLPWALERVYGMRTLLFFGCSLQNDRTAGVIKSIMSDPENVGIKHFALVEEPVTPEGRRVRLDELEALHIAPLFFPKGQYHRIEDFIAFLAKARDPRLSERKKSDYYFLLSVSPLPESSRDSYNVKLEKELGEIGMLKRAQKMTLLENEHASYKESYEKQFRTFVYEAPKESWLLTILPEDTNWGPSPQGQEAFSATEADFVYELARRGKRVIFFESGESMRSAIAGARKKAEWRQEWKNPIMVLNTDSEAAVNGLINHIDTMPVPPTEKGHPVVIVTIAGPDKPVANRRRRLFNTFLSKLHQDHEYRLIRGENEPYYAPHPHREWLQTAHLRTASTVCLTAWHEELAYNQVKALCGICDFENPRCRVLFLCGSDQLALGALRAVKELAGARGFGALKKRVFFFGIDGLDRMTKLLSDEEIFGHTMKVKFNEMRDYVERAIKDPDSFEGQHKPVGFEDWQGRQ